MAANSYNAFGPTRARPKKQLLFADEVAQPLVTGPTRIPLTTDGGRRLRTGASATMARPAEMETLPDVTPIPLRKPEPRTVKQRGPITTGRIDREKRDAEQRRARERLAQENRLKPPPLPPPPDRIQVRPPNRIVYRRGDLPDGSASMSRRKTNPVGTHERASHKKNAPNQSLMM